MSKISKDSTGYLIFFASMVTLVAGVTLAVIATSLHPYQARNIALEKKKFILTAIDYSAQTPEEWEAAYEKYIDGVVIDQEGNVVEGEAFDIDPVEQDRILAANPSAKVQYPLYKYTSDEGDVRYIVPVNGKGLWGPIWGYVAVTEDYREITGTIFDHQGETPGLGAELVKDNFRQSFIGKELYDEEDKLVAVTVLKGTGNEVDEHTVDGISGATITGNGVTEMLQSDLRKYEPFFEKLN